MTLPNFVVIGGVRCGTTSLYMYLKRHPEIFMSRLKEPCFLLYENRPVPDHTPRNVTRLEDYEALFTEADGARAIGEATALCLYDWETAIPNIRRHLPDARFIAILRNPIDRAHSQFLMARREDAEPLDDFSAALAAEDERVEEGAAPIFHYARQSLYAGGVEAYLDAFGPDRVRFYRFSRLKDPGELLADVFAFLDVDESAARDAWRVHNASLPPRHRRLQKAMARPGAIVRTLARAVPRGVRRSVKNRLLRWNRAPKPELRPEVRRELADRFREDVHRLSDLLERDFTGWLE